MTDTCEIMPKSRTLFKIYESKFPFMFVYIAFVQNKFVVKILVERIGGDGAPIRKFQRVRAVIADG